MEELRRRVAVDFSADPTELVKMPAGNDKEPPFRVITLQSGR
jgi:hypothetical protein